MTTPISPAAISRILSNAGIKKQPAGSAWSKGFLSETYGPDACCVWYSESNDDARREGMEQIVSILNTHDRYTACIENYQTSNTPVVVVRRAGEIKTGYQDGKWHCRCGATNHYSCLCVDKPVSVPDIPAPADMQPTAQQEAATVRQYAELGEDDLIALISHIGSTIKDSADKDEDSRILAELEPVILALTSRRNASVPARERIGEYLRQQGLVQAKYQKDLAGSDYSRQHATPPQEELDFIHTDPYARSAVLLLSDLMRLASATVRDTKTEFFAEQQERLQALLTANPKMPEKQQNLLRCIAQGHIVRSAGWGNSRYVHELPYGDSGQDCGDHGNANTVNALMKRKLTSVRPASALHRSTLMLKKPQ